MMGNKLMIHLSEYLSEKEKKAVEKAIRDYRISSGYTQRTFAQFLGVKRTTAQAWEIGDRTISLVRAFELHRKTNGKCGVKVTRPDFIKFLQDFKDVIDDLKI